MLNNTEEAEIIPSPSAPGNEGQQNKRLCSCKNKSTLLGEVTRFSAWLLQRVKARGIPDQLLRWIRAFCSGRTATILVNGHTSESRNLPQAGLPQGSPLSPILFLFFNADLVQRRIDCYGGAIAFVDEFTAWVTGPTAQSNREGIEAIIDDALAWERRSGAAGNHRTVCTSPVGEPDKDDRG
ncbi:hypothetical protein PG994_015222 [Apiospora phragmitis]|uniref:Reverse transcriptase domain-containing protein n=1 Tax=Apiospora phragmitis TaxID=2905665 RepID=A0ABR1SSL3_9PEZI